MGKAGAAAGTSHDTDVADDTAAHVPAATDATAADVRPTAAAVCTAAGLCTRTPVSAASHAASGLCPAPLIRRRTSCFCRGDSERVKMYLD